MPSERMDLCYLRICREYSRLSHCLSRQVGALLVLPDGSPIAMGYNGPPRDIPHCDEFFYCPGCFKILRDEDCGCGEEPLPVTDRCPRRLGGQTGSETIHQCPAVHAELNALLTCARTNNSTVGCSLYIYPLGPCKDCAAAIIQAGVSRLVYIESEPYDELSPWLLSQSSVDVVTYPIESL